MNLIVEITQHNDNIQKFECVDFPFIMGGFTVMQLLDFKREYMPNDFIKSMKTYFN